jgi:hypothetical protein
LRAWHSLLAWRARLPLLVCGDVEANPGPSHHHVLLDSAISHVITSLELPHPPSTATFTSGPAPPLPYSMDTPATWATTWSTDIPLLLNPPFGLLPEITHRIERSGGHLILIVPSWSSVNKALHRVCRRRFQFDVTTPIYGPPGIASPKWLTFAYYIRFMPTREPTTPQVPRPRGRRPPSPLFRALDGWLLDLRPYRHPLCPGGGMVQMLPPRRDGRP